MELVSNALQKECAMGAVMVGYFLYYYEAWILPAMLRQEKLEYSWQGAWSKYHNNIYKFNYAYDRELRYSAISRNLLLENINHTKSKSAADHVYKMISANKKVYDALTPSSKRLLIWQVQPALQ